MFKTIINAWKIADLRKKMLFTALIVFIFRLGAALPVPFVNISGGLISDQNANNFMTYLSMMTGDAFNYGTLFAMSITPYINASIIIELLTVAIPALERLAKEGEEGRKKISTITRYSSVVLALMQSTAYYFYIRSQNYLSLDADGSKFTGFFAVLQAITIIFCYTAGASLIMWLGEQINEKGIGNGISIILFAGIVSRMPTTLYSLYSYMDKGGAYYALAPIAFVSLILMIGFIVWMDNAERRIPVQYAKRVVGRKMYGGQNTHIPIKVNMCGVLPIIFASSILSLPPTIQMFVTVKEDGFWAGFFKILNNSLGIRNYVLCVDYILRIFLCSHSVQSHRNGEQHPQEQRCHPRHSSRQAHVGLYHQDIVKTYIARCSSSVGSCAFPASVLTDYGCVPSSGKPFTRRYFHNHYGRRCS